MTEPPEPEDALDDSLDKIRRQIADWLLAEGWKVSEQADEPGETAWALQCVDPGGKLVLFAQDSRKPDVLLMQAGVNIDPDHARRLAALPADEQEEFCWDLRFRLLTLSANFGGVQVPLERVGLVERLYLEDLGRNQFFRAVSRLQNGILAVIWSVRRRLERAETPPADDAVVH